MTLKLIEFMTTPSEEIAVPMPLLIDHKEIKGVQFKNKQFSKIMTHSGEFIVYGGYRAISNRWLYSSTFQPIKDEVDNILTPYRAFLHNIKSMAITDLYVDIAQAASIIQYIAMEKDESLDAHLDHFADFEKMKIKSFLKNDFNKV